MTDFLSECIWAGWFASERVHEYVCYFGCFTSGKVWIFSPSMDPMTDSLRSPI